MEPNELLEEENPVFTLTDEEGQELSFLLDATLEFEGKLYAVLYPYDPENQEIIDDICIVKDEEAIRTSKELASKEGILCGISSGTNVAAAIKLAKKLGPGKTVVTVLPDTAERYFSTPLFDHN